MNLSLLTYTHSNCSDIYKLYFDSVDAFFKPEKNYVLVNKLIDDNRINQIIYNNDTDYSEQMLLGLSRIDTEYLIYSQEDYILYNNVNLDLLNESIELLNNNKDIMFIRLIRSGLTGNEEEYNDNFVKLDNQHEYFYSTQITLWRKECLEKMFKLSKTKHITEESKNSKFLKLIGGIGVCSKLGNEKVGGHYNSIIYPYIATAIVKGKWNFTEYGDKLDVLLNNYNIDKNKRGIF